MRTKTKLGQRGRDQRQRGRSGGTETWTKTKMKTKTELKEGAVKSEKSGARVQSVRGRRRRRRRRRRQKRLSSGARGVATFQSSLLKILIITDHVYNFVMDYLLYLTLQDFSQYTWTLLSFFVGRPSVKGKRFLFTTDVVF